MAGLNQREIEKLSDLPMTPSTPIHLSTTRPHRISAFSDAASLLGELAAWRHASTTGAATTTGAGNEGGGPPVRAAPPSPDPELDMRTISAYLSAVAAQSAAAARFRLEAGECAVVDNYRLADGREAYTDLRRALWQVWVCGAIEPLAMTHASVMRFRVYYLYL